MQKINQSKKIIKKIKNSIQNSNNNKYEVSFSIINIILSRSMPS